MSPILWNSKPAASVVPISQILVSVMLQLVKKKAKLFLCLIKRHAVLESTGEVQLHIFLTSTIDGGQW